jgi:GH18 family chitinase
MKGVLRFMAGLALAALSLSCGRGERVVETTPVSVPDESEGISGEGVGSEPVFRVIAYVTGGVVPEVIPYDRLTHINYAFLIPNDDGTFAPFANDWKLEKIVTEAHQRDVRVLISVGGWGWDEQFETMAAGPDQRGTFVRELAAFVDDHDLDGADIDWEYPDPGRSAGNFLALIRELRLAMPDKLLTTAVVSHGETGEGVPRESFDLFDFVNVMTYAGSDHGNMAQFEAGRAYWQGRGLSADKTVMGVPFYAEPGGTAYGKIVEAQPGAAYTDAVEWHGRNILYNGIPTIQAKTRQAMAQAGGIMFWTLDHDALGELSLLRAIDEVVRQEESGAIKLPGQ